MRNLCSKLLLLVIAISIPCNSVPSEQFYAYGTDAGDKLLSAQDEGSTSELELRTPFVFYGETYFTLFVNVNGIISFLTEIPYFFNAQFPLDYPVIAPFYSDVDTTGTGSVYYRETSDPTTIQRVSADILENFENDEEFEPKNVFIATWDSVGAFQGRRDKVNTFQVVLTTDSRESYAIFYYADNGIQWLQGDGKTSGLPDAIGQAGFIAADGRTFSIRSSGTDQVRNLDKWSNVGQPGVWMFRVGRILPGKNIQPPNKVGGFPGIQGAGSFSESFWDSSSCASGGSVCHSSGFCQDYTTGFCCSCNEDYYGNGINCLKEDAPSRVTGKLHGSVNGIDIEDADLHSYVLPADGRTYTAVSRIPKEVGYDLQSLTGIGEGIAWLFATPKEGVQNGFSLTGGLFNRTVEIKFPQTGHTTHIEQVFQGLDVFNNIAVDTKVSGSLPTIPVGSELEVDAFKEEFTRVKLGQIRAHSSRNFVLKGQTLETPYTVETTINFDECGHSPKNPEFDTLRLKIAENIFIRFDMAESIVRYSFTAKIGTLEEEDPCIKGKDECGPNSQCIVDGDNFRCVCEQGYDYIFDETENALICLDINECDIGRDLCHAEAVCINSEGSYACKCQNGYTGDGYYCNPEVTCNNAGCDSNAFCRVINQIPECECNVGYKGDGFFCTADFGDESCHILQNCSPYAVCAPTANGYACRCLQGYMGDGYYCDVDSQNQAGDLYNIPYGGSGYPQEGAEQQPLPPSYPDSIPTLRPYQPNEQLDNNLNERPLEEIQPTCLLEICWCPAGYDYNRLEGTCVESSSAPFDLNPIPQCHGDSSCSCPSGYLYNPIYGRCDTISEAPPCNVVNNCHPNAHCMHHGLTGTSECTCNTGYVGDGFSCRPVDVSCDQVDICHYNADCIYDDIQLRSVCVCKPEFSGDGLVCLPKDNCDSGSECDANAQCLFDSSSQRFLCTCNEGFSGDGFSCLADREEESCATLRNCDPDADCQFSPESRRYECRCRDGFEGDGVQCLQVQTGCNPACGTNADCIYDGYNRRYDCKCIPGFTGDGMYCREAQTCISDHSICDPNALCQRTSSDEYDHACICISGYTGDGFSCEKSPDHEKNILLINQGLSVLRMSIDINSGNGFPIHVDPFMTAVGADVDCLNGLYYWTDVASQTIRSSKYDGQDKKPVITGGVTGSPEDVTVDWISRNIYWTDSKNNVLGVAEMDGMMTKTVIEGNLVNPRGITCHPGLGFLFWSDWNRDNPKIEKSGMDGSERTVLVSGTGVSLPNSLAIDFETSTLCWADAGMHRIECIGIQGYGRRIIIDGIKYPFGLALHTNSFFYTDWNDTRIHEVSKYTGKEESSRIPPPGGSGRLYGIAVVPDQCPPVSNVCQVNKGNCPSTHLCLPNGRGGRTCACPDQASEEECTDRQY